MQILNHLLLTEGLSFRHTGWHSTELQPSTTHPSPHRSQDSASAAHGQGLCAHSGPQRLRTGVGVTLLGPGAEMSLCSPARSCPPALATAARHGLQPRGCRPRASRSHRGSASCRAGTIPAEAVPPSRVRFPAVLSALQEPTRPRGTEIPVRGPSRAIAPPAAQEQTRPPPAAFARARAPSDGGCARRGPRG